MYQAHFGLTAPFAATGIARDARVFVGGARQRLVQRLDHALARGDAVALVTGAPGTGKTTLAAHAVRARGTRLAFGWIPHVPQHPAELLEQLLAEFDVAAAAPGGRPEPLRAWRQFLDEMALTDTAVCVLVERAAELGTDVLRALESLTAADPSGSPGANLVLMARTSLAERLARPGLEGLAQRVGANLAVHALTAAETRAYLEFELAACSAELDAVVDASGVAALHERTGGVIRVLENLAECALTLAAERGLERVDAGVVDAAAEELGCATTAGHGAVNDAAAALEVESAGAAAAVPVRDGAAPASAPDGAPAAPRMPAATAEVPVLTDTAAEPCDVPTLTDAVDAPGADADTLMRDVLAAGAGEAAHGSAPAADTAPDEPADAPAPADTLDDDDESDDFEAVANALAFEDFSNFVAESLFGDEELGELGQTLATPEHENPPAANPKIP